MLSLAERLSGSGAEAAVWDVYSEAEKLIAILKFRLDYETPGVFTKLPDAGDHAKLVKSAHEQLSKAAEEIARGRLVESIETLRKARNALRSYLTDKRKSASRAQRKTRTQPPRAESTATK
ncbi:MAG TPA: hypothetical protein VGS04_05805 [Nitrososphaerales archaeon]|nr:hypothetical protein [Nitrososphaerales archaeon]